MDYLETVVKLPPGTLTADRLRRTLHLVFDDFGWFEPARYGRVTPDTELSAGAGVLERLLELGRERHRLAVGSEDDRHVLLLSWDRPGEYSNLGRLIWLAPAGNGRDSGWRDAHAVEVAALMREVNSPYAFAGPSDDLDQKTRRETTDHRGFTMETFTVRDHSEGLAGLFWRNFFGAPFRTMFGTVLADVSRDLDGIALVEPYVEPGTAFNEEGRAREAELIAYLGADCFYDRARQTLPTRRPRL